MDIRKRMTRPAITGTLGALLALWIMSNCSSKKDAGDTSSQDSEQQMIPSRLMPDGRVWMTENLSVELPGSYCHGDDSLNCARYGRLYTWESARKGCLMLGNGWRLPTDDEWRTMAKGYGGTYQDSDDKGRSAYLHLSEGGSGEFDAVLGGNREPNGNYERLGAHGFYWTATESDSTQAWFYNFGKGSTLLNRHTGDKNRAISVRCIKEAP